MVFRHVVADASVLVVQVDQTLAVVPYFPIAVVNPETVNEKFKFAAITDSVCQVIFDDFLTCCTGG